MSKIITKIIINFTLFSFILSITNTDFYLLEKPLISDVQKSRKTYHFSIGKAEYKVEERESLSNKSDFFFLDLEYESMLFKSRCDIDENMIVTCTVKSRKKINFRNMVIKSNYCYMIKSHRTIRIGKDHNFSFNLFLKEINRLRNSFDTIKSMLVNTSHIETINNRLNNIESLLYLKGDNIIKLNIGFFFPKMNGGGTERFIANLANNLIKTNLYNIYIFSGKKHEDDFDLDDKIIWVNVYKKFRIQRRRFLSFLNNNRIDVVIFSHYTLPDVRFLSDIKSEYNLKVVIMIHSFLMHEHNKRRPNALYDFYSQIKDIDCLVRIVPNEDFLWKRLNIPSYYIPNIPKYDPDQIESANLTEKTLILVGRGFSKTKRFDLGIMAMKHIVQKVPEAKLQIISGGNLSHLKMLVYKYNLTNNVFFLGYHKNPERFYKNSSIHLLPSSFEGYPYVLLEAKTLGLANIVSGKKYLALNKKGTVIVPPNDPKAIAEEAVKLLNDFEYRKRLGKEAKESLRELTREKIVSIWNNFFFFCVLIK